MAKKATATDAQLILQLYDLRREAEMRKARNWWFVSFWPRNADDFMKIAFAPGSQENNWLRQVSGYWSMAASFVLQGCVECGIIPAAGGERRNVYRFRESLSIPERAATKGGRPANVQHH